MKPAPFEYHRPASVSDAVALLGQHGDEAKILAGGQSLVPLLSLRLARFSHLVDVNEIGELSTLAADAEGVTLGTMVRQATAEHSSEVASTAPLVSRALPLIGHFQIRNRGTVGGSLAHADPASELPAVALALGATFEVASPRGTRRVDASDFFQGTWTTAIEADEMLVRVWFPKWVGAAGFAIEEAVRRHGDFAMVGAACGVASAEGKVTRAAVAHFGVASTPIRATAAEKALVGASVAELNDGVLNEVAQLAVRDLDPPSDVHATGSYRKRAGAVITARALARALQEVAA